MTAMPCSEPDVRYAILSPERSRSFPAGDPVLAGASKADEAQLLIVCGDEVPPASNERIILIELDLSGLAERIGDDSTRSDVVGFARYRNGEDPPSALVELVRQPRTATAALATARGFFEAMGLTVCVCADRPGRIVDRLVRPKYNAALRFLDEGLGSLEDIDATCRLGLGYPDGPLERVMRGGLARHYDVSRALYDATAEAAYAPARRAVVAHTRRRR